MKEKNKGGSTPKNKSKCVNRGSSRSPVTVDSETTTNTPSPETLRIARSLGKGRRQSDPPLDSPSVVEFLRKQADGIKNFNSARVSLFSDTKGKKESCLVFTYDAPRVSSTQQAVVTVQANFREKVGLF